MVCAINSGWFFVVMAAGAAAEARTVAPFSYVQRPIFLCGDDDAVM